MQGQSLASMLACLLLCCSCLLVKETTARSTSTKAELLERLRYTHYMRGSLAGEDGNPLTVKLGLVRAEVVKADTSTNELSLVIWTSLSWKTPFGWESLGLGNASTLKVPVDKIWIPDVVCYTLAGAPEPLFPGISAVLMAEGTVIYVPGQRVKIMCNMEGIDSEEGTVCGMKFGSWTHNGNEIDIQVQDNSLTFNEYNMGSKYEILSSTARRQELAYACCPEPYVEIVYMLRIRRKRSESFLSDWF